MDKDKIIGEEVLNICVREELRRKKGEVRIQACVTGRKPRMKS